MYRKCATEISEQHQRQVADALLVLMQKMPYEDITVTQLCQCAGVTRRVFYHLFSNKTGALHALVDHRILDYEGYDRTVLRGSLRFFRYWMTQKPFLDALCENGFSGLLLERMLNLVLAEDFDVFHWLNRHGWSDSSKELIIFGLSGIMGLVYSWYHSGFRKAPEEMADLLERIALPYIKEN